MIKKKKLYLRPKKLYEKSRIEEENVLVKKYALKNKTEIWKSLAKVNYYRTRAKALARAPMKEQEILFNKLKALGLNTNTIADVLGLQVEDILKRRLSTIVAEKKLAQTPKHARQLIVHKKILINNKAMNSPSYLVKVSEEDVITLKKKERKSPAPKQEKEETSEESSLSEEKTMEEKQE